MTKDIKHKHLHPLIPVFIFCIITSLNIQLTNCKDPLPQSQILRPEQLAITIYNDNFALIKDTRLMEFFKGESVMYFDDVAENIQTQTVTFKALSRPQSVRVYEQNFQKNLISVQGVLDKYIEKEVIVFIQLGNQVRKVTGKLLGYKSGYILQTQNGVQIYNKVAGVQLPQRPKDFFTKPTLNWKVWSSQKQQTLCQVAYRTTGFKWSADYSLILNNEETQADIGGWVTIDNNSGKKYQNAKLKLIAGQVNTVKTIVPRRRSFNGQQLVGFAKKSVKPAPQFVQKSFSDYHMYTLSQPVTINTSSRKQVEFIPKVYNIEIQKYHQIRIQAGGSPDTNLQIKNKINFKNSKKVGLGIPFPKGTIRVFKSDEEDNSLEFIGEDSTKHTPKQENITIVTGKSFDIVGKKMQNKYETLNNIGGFSAELQMKVKNNKQIKVDVLVIFSNIYRDNLELEMIQGQQPQRYSASEYRWRKTLQANQQWIFSWKETRTI